MSAITLTAASWISFLAGSTAAERAAAWAAFGVDTIEFLDASNSVIRTVTCGAWTVGTAQSGSYPVTPGTYTDSATGSGTPVTAVFKAGSTEKWRCSCGTAESNFYRLRANIVAGVPISRGSFAVLIGPPPAPGVAAPTVVTAPVITGTPVVGNVLECTPGVYAGNPVPTVTRQWYRGSVAIPGATGLAYTLVSADLSAIIKCVETPQNSVSSLLVTSNLLGPVSTGGITLTVPAINITQGGTYSLAQHVAGGTPPYSNYAVEAGTLPAGVTLNAASGVLSATGGATTGTVTGLRFGVDDSTVAATLPQFGVISSVGGTNVPFTFGHPFKKGDVPAGQFVDSDLTDWQVNPLTYWDDGSLKHAIISGRANLSANVEKKITLSVSSTNRTGTALTEAHLAAAIATVATAGGSDVATLNTLIGTSALKRTICSGPVMSSFLYRKAVAGSNHLVSWFEVRLYVGGAVEVLPFVENAYLTVANPVNDVRTWTFSVGGTARFSQSIDLKHHSRAILANGQSITHWINITDPQVSPRHDVNYLAATKLIPNFGWRNPSQAKLNGLQQTYSPNTLAGINSSMGVAGSSAAILNNPDALYVVSADPRAWRASVVFAASGGSWSTHFRDQATNDPFKFSDFPDASIQVQGTPTIPEGSGPTNGNAVISHQPSYGYLQWLCSGRWFFLEEMLFWSGWNYLYNTVDNRKGAGSSGANGVIKTSSGANTDRGGAWGMRTLAQALALLPTTHPCYASLKASWEANTAWYKALVIDGTVDGGASVNSLGVMGFYGSFAGSVYDNGGDGQMYGAGWMQAMVHQVLGFTWDIELPQDSASATRHQAIRDHGYSMEVGRTGDGSGGSWHYRNFIAYGLNWGAIGGTYYGSWNTAYPFYKARYGITNENDGGTSLFSHSSQTVLAPGSSSLPYFGQALTALAYAVDHGKAGASTGWSRIAAASNFASYTEAEFNDAPEYGVVPRT